MRGDRTRAQATCSAGDLVTGCAGCGELAAMILAFLWEGLLQEQEGSDWWGVSHRLRLRILWQECGLALEAGQIRPPLGLSPHPPAIIRCNTYSLDTAVDGVWGAPNRHSWCWISQLLECCLACFHWDITCKMNM